MTGKQEFGNPPPYSEQFPSQPDQLAAQRYAPQPGYNQPAAQGYAPQPGFDQPSAKGYAPQPGYAPQGGYNPQGYPPPQGYPQTQGYPGSQQHGYPPSQPSYPGQQPYGVQQQSSTVVVTNQPYMGPAVVEAGPYPPDYLILSIFACLCCFWPTGLCAIYFASRRNTLVAQGDNIEANRMATSARNLTILSVILGICWIVVAIVVRVLAANSVRNDPYEY